jgi:hypothetical protein
MTEVAELDDCKPIAPERLLVGLRQLIKNLTRVMDAVGREVRGILTPDEPQPIPVELGESGQTLLAVNHVILLNPVLDHSLQKKIMPGRTDY